MTAVTVLSEEQLLEVVRKAVDPLRVELERLRGDAGGELVTLAEAARRLGRTRRTLQRWARTGRLPVEHVGGARLVRLPPGVPGR